MKIAQVSAVVALAAVAGFVAIVAALHLAQPGYDPRHQLMSELALGPNGGWMLAAFLSLAASVLAVAILLRARAAGPAVQALMLGASAAFASAGIFPLGETTDLHVASIALAFVLAVLAMYLAPSAGAAAAHLAPRALSWPLAAGVAIAVALGHSVLPMGIGQRLAAACLLLWLLAVAARALLQAAPGD